MSDVLQHPPGVASARIKRDHKILEEAQVLAAGHPVLQSMMQSGRPCGFFLPSCDRRGQPARYKLSDVWRDVLMELKFIMLTSPGTKKIMAVHTSEDVEGSGSTSTSAENQTSDVSVKHFTL